MGSCIQFSEADRFLNKNLEAKACLVDSSFLVAISDEDHSQHDDAQFLFEKLAEYNIRIFVINQFFG